MKKNLNLIKKGFRAVRVINNRLRLQNKTFSIITSNCIGGVIYNELGCRFLSPTINLYILPSDFVKFVENLKYYLSLELNFEKNNKKNFPVASLGDIKIYFMHYKSDEEARKKWIERSKRINFNNIFVVMIEKDQCTEKDIVAFENLNYKNKIIFTNNKRKNYNSCFHISGFEEKKEIGNIMEYKNIFGKKYYDQFDFVKWLNSNKEN